MKTDPSKAVTWTVDLFAQTIDGLEASKRAHRMAGFEMHSCMPKRSAINGGYYAEINRYHGNGVLVPNVALGTGPTPLHAALDGYAKAMPHKALLWAAYRLELEAELLHRAIRNAGRLEKKLEAALEDLALLLLTITPIAPLRITDEDDDL